MNLNTLSKDDLVQLQYEKGEVNITIEKKGANKALLEILNEVLAKKDIAINLVIDNREHSDDENAKGLDIAACLPNLKRLSMQAVLTVAIESIEQLAMVEEITQLKIYGFIKNGISLQPIERFQNITTFELENGLNKKQQKIIDSYSSLESLQVSELTLSSFTRKEKLTKLRIHKNLIDADRLAEVMPGLRFLSLEGCKKISDFTFISSLKQVTELSIRHIKHISDLPDFNNPSIMKTVNFINSPNIKNIDSIFACTGLTGFMATELSKLNTADFNRLSELKNLKNVYITFKDKAENDRIQEFVERNGWEYRQPGLASQSQQSHK